VLGFAEPQRAASCEHVEELVGVGVAAVARELEDALREELDLEQAPVGALV
jgi:hypothetical protein